MQSSQLTDLESQLSVTVIQMTYLEHPEGTQIDDNRILQRKMTIDDS